VPLFNLKPNETSFVLGLAEYKFRDHRWTILFVLDGGGNQSKKDAIAFLEGKSGGKRIVTYLLHGQEYTERFEL
jgi:hypothetical protein